MSKTLHLGLCAVVSFALTAVVGAAAIWYQYGQLITLNLAFVGCF
ncbi:MAG: hypothetical protein AAF228_05085 [Pseudomonadota bacterium]